MKKDTKNDYLYAEEFLKYLQTVHHLYLQYDYRKSSDKIKEIFRSKLVPSVKSYLYDFRDSKSCFEVERMSNSIYNTHNIENLKEKLLSLKIGNDIKFCKTKIEKGETLSFDDFIFHTRSVIDTANLISTTIECFSVFLKLNLDVEDKETIRDYFTEIVLRAENIFLTLLLLKEAPEHKHNKNIIFNAFGSKQHPFTLCWVMSPVLGFPASRYDDFHLKLSEKNLLEELKITLPEHDYK